LGKGDGGAFGLGTATARGGVALAFGSGVSLGFAEVFLCSAGVFSAPGFFFFFPFSDSSLDGDFFAFDFGFGDAFGVSLGFGDASDSSVDVFFALVFGFGDGDGDFFFLLGELLGFAIGVGDLSLTDESTARAFRIGFPSSVCCARETKTVMSALSAKQVASQTRKRNTERSVTECFARSTGQHDRNDFTLAALPPQPDRF
jgi:hypothetical protein